jgi:hypothetical protein
MSTYYDTSAPGGSPLTASGQVFFFGQEVYFYLSVSSNGITGQATGPSIQFLIYSKRDGVQSVNVDYATTNTQEPARYSGYLINAVVPTVGGNVSARVVVSTDPFPLTVRTVAAVTQNVQVVNQPDVNVAQIGGFDQHAGDIVAPIQSVGGTVNGSGQLTTDAGAASIVPSSSSPTGKALATKVEST